MITSISEVALIQLIEQTVRKVLAEQQQPKQPEQALQWVSGKELCTALDITRQTLANWYKSSDTKKALEPLRVKRGGKWWYEIEGIIKLINEQGYLFGRGKGYAYKDATGAAAKQRKSDNRFYSIHWKAMAGTMLTIQEELYYREVCTKRGVACLLKPK